MKKVLLLAVGTMLVYSCNKSADKTTTTEASTEMEAPMQDEHQTSGESAAIRLDNNQKWMVNNEMKPFVMKGEQLVNSYVETKQTDYKMLAKQVKEQNEKLIKSCTMDGASHDELHKWLHPHLELTKKLESEKDAAMADATVKDLQKSYLQYHEYFN